VLVNHLKSKGYGSPRENNATRLRQATRVAEIVRSLRARGERNIVVLGDLNHTPDSMPLAPLLDGAGLRDIQTHPSFTSDGRNERHPVSALPDDDGCRARRLRPRRDLRRPGPRLTVARR
jgi:endonuclease/exonuclease/phosphatase family metal-dependent hydrolase